MGMGLLIALGVIAGLISWFGWEASKKWLSNRTSTVETKARRFEKSVEAELDELVADAEKWWPHLRKMPLFWMACLGTACMILLDVWGAYHLSGAAGSTGGQAVIGFIVWALLLSIADLALPYISLKSDKGTASFFDVENKAWKSDRSTGAWFAIISLTLLSCVVVVASTSEVSNSSNAQKQISALGYQTKLDNIERWRDELAKLPQDRSYAALQALADSAKAEAELENSPARGGCGSKCDRLRRQAADFQSRADDAKKKKELEDKIAFENGQLSTMSGGGTVANPFSRNMEGLSQGYIAAAQVDRYGAIFFGFACVFVVSMLWLFVSDSLSRAIHKAFTVEAEEADRIRATKKLPPKYTVGLTATTAEPSDAEANAGDGGETLVINMQSDDMRKRFPNDTSLLEADALFGTLLLPDPDTETTIDAVFKAYRRAALQDGRERHMLESTLASKLYTVAQHRDDVRIDSTGTLRGWSLVNTDKAEQPVLHAAE